ncbi:MAG: XrtA system polysaccharide deacetylase [Stellaceae bacterium]
MTWARISDAAPLPDAAVTPSPGNNSRNAAMCNAMSVDVEDFFQVQAFANVISRDDWPLWPCRIERNMDLVLRLLADAGARATFFTLGWIAERYPEIVRSIVAQGHELASHGYAHVPITAQTPDEFRADIRKARQILEQIGQVEVKGYRAATFSMTKRTAWAFDILAEEGHAYSSSIYPIRHDLYGIPDAPRFAHRVGSGPLLEIPMSTVALFGRNLPCSGGGYFRLLPYSVSAAALRRFNRRDGRPGVFYFHPWEIDPDQPRVPRVPWRNRVRHYVNLSRMEAKLRRLLRDFAWDRLDRVFLRPAEAREP